MPLSQEDIRNTIIKSGYNPDDYDGVESSDGQVELRPKNKLQPTVSSSPAPSTLVEQRNQTGTTEAPSMGGAFGRSVIRNAPAAVIGGAGSVVGGAAGGAMAGSVFPGVGTAIGAILGGAAAAYGAKKLQDPLLHAVLPQESYDAYKAREAADTTQQPLASKVGGAASMVAGGLSPSPSNLGAGARSVARLLRGNTLLNAERANLVNIGTGAAISPAMQAGESVLTGHGIPSAGDLLESAAMGALMNKPNAIGVRMGMHPQPEGPIIPEVIGNRDTLSVNGINDNSARRKTATAPAPAEVSVPNVGIRELTPDAKTGTVELSDRGLLKAQTAGNPYASKESLDATFRQEHPDVDTMANEGGYVPHETPTESEVRYADFVKAQKELAQQEHQRNDLVKQETEQLKAENEQRQLRMRMGSKGTAESIMSESLGRKPEVRDTQYQHPVRDENGNLVQDYIPEIESGKLPQVSAEESAHDLEMRRLEGNTGDKYQEEGRPKVAEEGKAAPIDNWVRNYAQKLGALRNIKVQEGNVPEGKSGSINTAREGIQALVANIKPEAPDTYPHEISHGFFEDLAGSPNVKDRELYQRALTAIEGSSEFAKYNEKIVKAGHAPVDANEFLAQATGENVIKQVSSKDTSFVKDFVSNIQSRYNDKASVDNFVRRLSNKVRFDAPFSETHPEGRVYKLGKEGLRYQSEGAPKQDDKKTVPEWLRQRMDEQIAKGWNPKWPFVQADLHNQSFIEAIKSDPTISDAEKSKILSFAPDGSNAVKLDLPESQKDARYIQDWNFGDKRLKMYNLNKDITDPSTGEVLHPKDSTVTENTLKKFGMKYQDEGRPKIGEEGGDKPKKKTPMDELKLIGFKDQLEGNIEQRVERAKELFKQSGLKVGDVLYSPKGTAMTITANGISTGKRHNPELDGKPTVYVKYKDANGDEVNGSAFLHMLSYEDPLEGARYQDSNRPKIKDDPAIEGKQSFLSALTSRIDKVAEVYKSDTAKEVTANLHKVLQETSRLEGFGNELINARKGYTPEEIQRENEYSYKKSQGDKEDVGFELTPKESELKDKLDELYRRKGQESIDLGMKVSAGDDRFRSMKLNEQGYRPPMLSGEVANEWATNGPKSEEYDSLYTDYLEKQGVSKEEALKELEDYKQQLGNRKTSSAEFGALRKVKGSGLPYELIKKNANVAANRYARRAARDMAMFKYLENDPRMVKALGIEDQYGNRYEEKAGDGLENVDKLGHTKEVRDALESVRGEDAPETPRINSAIRAVGSSIMGTGTAARNLLQSGVTIAPFKGVNPKSIVEAIMTMNDKAQRAYANGAIKSSYKDFDAAGHFEGNPDKVVQYIDKYVNFMRKWSGRDLSDHLEGLFNYSLGEDLATKWFAAAKNGDIESRSMLQKFGNTVDGLTEKITNREEPVTAEDIGKIAKAFTDNVRGTYDARGLPSVAIKGQAAPFLSLSRWSIERSNHFYKDVVKPAQQGNWNPLLKTTFAALLSGAAIEQLNELLSGKKGQDPTVSEVLANSDPENVTAKAIGLMQLGSFAGIVSDAAKFGSNMAQGKDTKFSTPISFPAGALAEEVSKDIGHTVDAIRQGEDPFKVLPLLVESLVKSSFQNGRYLLNRTDDEDAQRKERFRDLRTFEDLTHKPDGNKGQVDTNPYLGIDARNFKQETDPEKAAGNLPAMIDDLVRKFADNPVELAKKLRSLKSNSYDTMPSPETDTQEFANYVEYLKRTKGEEKAKEVLEDYFKMNAINKAKSSMIPST